jgi:hypothetical protein
MDKEMKKVNKSLELLMQTEPLLEFKEAITEEVHEMKFGLAQVYGNRGFRKYMEMLIKSQMEATLRAETINDVFYIKGRILTLKELLAISRTEFNNIEKLKKLNENKK